MKKILGLAITFLALLPAARAADKVVDLSGGCKVYKLQAKKWVETDSAGFEGLGLAQNQILRDAAFTVFKANGATFGVNQRCVRAADAAPAETPQPAEKPAPVARRRSAAPAPARGDNHSPWSAVFSLGYNLAPKAEITSTYLGASSTVPVTFKGSLSFLGEANYRMNRAFRLGLELGLSQLQVNDQSGNETSFFDTRPEFIFHASPKIEIYIGPMIGLFFLSQNTESQALTGSNAGTTIAVKQQTASAILVGAGIGADYMLNAQFDVGFFLRYFKPGALKITGTESFPTAGNTYEASLSTSYINSGFRFAIHF